MTTSVFDLFRIGLGPSSSHTVGPMLAARTFVLGLEEKGLLETTAAVRVELFGSLAATARGHATDRAVILGLLGERPDELAPERATELVRTVAESGRLALLGRREIPFQLARDLRLELRPLPFHPNALRLTATGGGGESLAARTFYSTGGGFVVEEGETVPVDGGQPPVPHPFRTGAELLAICARHGLAIHAVMRANEEALRPAAEVAAGLRRIWQTMEEAIQRGCRASGTLPGGLALRRRAPDLFARLTEHPESGLADPLTAIDWVSLYALAVSEENAAGSRVVTAPTNGAAGIVPAVLHYYWRYIDGATEAGVIDFLLTAGAIGILYKENASISGAEVGCQGEVGVACSMAAGGLCAVLGGTPAQVENAAEIGMEHHLGLTCDPVGGLVQIPCIERNALASVKAINAARMALHGDGTHHVSLDQVIKTMRETGADMMTKYKETSRGGLAVNIVEC